MALKHIQTPLTDLAISDLKSGDKVLITGTIYTARDAAHARLVKLLEEGKPLPIPIKGEIIYYVGPTPTKPGNAFGSGGPTTSYRMDSYTPQLLNLGLKGMIGKGKRSEDVVDAMIQNKAVYFGAIGGAAALIGKSVKKAEIVAYEDLDSEAIRKLDVVDFPAVVVIDCDGNNLYEQGKAAYLKSIE